MYNYLYMDSEEHVDSQVQRRVVGTCVYLATIPECQIIDEKNYKSVPCLHSTTLTIKYLALS